MEDANGQRTSYWKALTSEEEVATSRACEKGGLTEAQSERVSDAMRNCEHLGINCDVTGQSPIVGPRYTREATDGDTFDVCADGFEALDADERATLREMPRPDLATLVAVVKAVDARDNGPSMKVTVLSGFLGAGKTTLLKRLLRLNNERGDDERLRMAVIVNDMGEINLDADEIKDSKLIHEDAEMVELHNGCICCTLRGDLLKTVKNLSQEEKYDYLVIESTGISEPLPVAQTFVMDVDEDPTDHPHAHTHHSVQHNDSTDGLQKVLGGMTGDVNSLSNYATLDTLVTVVDALNIFDVLHSLETLADKNNVTGMLGNTGALEDEESKIEQQGDGGEDKQVDDRSIGQLMVDQIEFANVIIVSKAAIFLKKESKEKLEQVKALLQKLNPKARLLVPLEDHYGDLDVAENLLNTGLFDMDEASASAGWLAELMKAEHTPETEEYGISSTIFRARNMPFHPERLAALLYGFGHYKSALEIGATPKGNEEDPCTEEGEEGAFLGVVRSKGLLWLANAHGTPMDFHTAGRHLSIKSSERPFLISMDKSDWEEEDLETHSSLVASGKWHEKWGDCESELVFIGVHLDKARIHEELSSALLTEEESKALGGVPGWRTLADPFFGGKAVELYFIEEGSFKKPESTFSGAVDYVVERQEEDVTDLLDDLVKEDEATESMSVEESETVYLSFRPGPVSA